ncbi:MAG: TIGR02281 family clan AA aspartic protease [Pseudomonadota bacterium]|nr:TIGR02281 family clan AA aspartic protease [Pseudomonadota bacterium]
MDFISDDIARLTYLLLILLSVVGWFISSVKRDLGKTIQRALIWFLIFVGLIGAYGLWLEIDKKTVTAELEKKIQIKKSIDGHFYTTAIINGKKIKLLIDTGASGTVLSSRDAKNAGILISELSFSNPIQTAAGLSYSAIYVVEQFSWLGLEIGPKRLQIVNQGLVSSLLGMDIIETARSFVISGDTLYLDF